MSELEKMAAGQFYDSETPELVQARVRVREAMLRFNACADSQERMAILRDVLGSIGQDSYVETGLRLDYGFHVHIGRRCYLNFNVVMLDCAPIMIGDDVLIGPNVGMYPPVHPLVAAERVARYDNAGRLYKIQYAKGIRIEDQVWIGGGVTINGGVTIGRGSVIGSGSVVTKDVPPGVFAAGNPCRVIRPIDPEKDSLLQAYFRQEG